MRVWNKGYEGVGCEVCGISTAKNEIHYKKI